MGKIKFLHIDDVQEVPAASGGSSGREAATKVSPEELEGISVRRYFGKEDGELEMFAVRLEPNHPLAPHAHRAAEIIFVTEGELVSGSRSLPAGSALHIEGNTLYGLRAGPNGLTFLNFRSKSDSTYLTKGEFTGELRDKNRATPDS